MANVTQDKMMHEDLVILIANLGSYENLRPCLDSVFSSADHESTFRVVVGFNFPGESDTPTKLANDFPQVEQFRAPMKLGYCRAYNQLMARNTGRYALLLDDDTVLPPGTIDGIVRFMEAHPRVGIAGCKTRNLDGSYQKTTARMYDLRSELLNVVRPAAFWEDGTDETDTIWKHAGWLNGHFLVVRSEVINEVGMLDEHYYTFQCEADWCLRIRRANWKVAYVPDVEVMHIGGAHSVTSRLKSYENLMRAHLNRYYFIRKHYGNPSLHVFRMIMSAGVLLRLLNYVLKWVFTPGRRLESGRKIAAYLRIFLLGFAPRPEMLPPMLQQQNDDAEKWP
ncbi:MAG: GT2 family glycosyltransferase [Gammaproteobacteria bacterium]